MAAWVLAIGLVVGILTVFSLLLGLRRAIQALVFDVVLRVLVDVGLIGPADKPRGQWPNGFTNLPAFLRSQWQLQEAMQATLHELVETEKEKDDN